MTTQQPNDQDKTAAAEQEVKIKPLEASLAELSAADDPGRWADTQHILAIAYRSRIRGDRADNIERAIEADEAVLPVRTREAALHDWADTQDSLATDYTNRIRGDRAENLEPPRSNVFGL